MNVAICGGGTGGHLHPLIALAEELEERKGVEITLFLNRKASLNGLPRERRVVTLEVSGLSRSLSPENLGVMVRLAKAFVLCRRSMKACGPQVAAALGGYASVPGAVAALTLGIPLVIHEQNVIPGLANRILAPFAERVAVSFSETLERYPGWRKKAVVTGNPMMGHPGSGSEEEPREYFGLQKGRKTLGVVGGSQGAESLNRAVSEALALWWDRGDLQVVHSVGRDKYGEFKSRMEGFDTGRLLYRPVEFIERMDLLYRAADLVVCRAGASTISELAAAGCAAVLVPFPYATAGHQEANAEVLEKAGAALVIADDELNGRRLSEEVDGLLDDPVRLERMRGSSSGIARPDAAARLAELVLSMA